MNTLTLEKHCWAEIDLTALRENYEYIRRTVGGPVCAVVKADAYGHGAVQVARKLEQLGADYLATGHYARTAPAPDGRVLLRKGLPTPPMRLCWLPTT